MVLSLNPRAQMPDGIGKCSKALVTLIAKGKTRWMSE